MSYAKVEAGHPVHFPYLDSFVRKDNPDTSFPSEMTDEIRAEYGAFPVVDIPPENNPSRQHIEKRPVSEWTFSNGKVKATYKVVDRSVDDRKALLIAQLKQKRWEVETGGVTASINGEQVLVSTARGDDRTALHVEFTRLLAGLRPDGSTFNFADTLPRSVTNEEMTGAINAALIHVQASFDTEDEITSLINAASTHEDLDAADELIQEEWMSG